MKTQTTWLFVLTLSFNIMGCSGINMLGAVKNSAISTDERSFQDHMRDSQLEIAINDIIHADRAVRKHTHINVYSVNAHVFLIGQAPNDMLHDQIIQSVQNSEYAKDIVLRDFIRIEKPNNFIQRSRDGLISTRLKTALLQHDSIDGKRIQLTTENAEVFLFGQITKEQASEAIHLARSYDGVKKVVHAFEYIDAPSSEHEVGSIEPSQVSNKEPTVKLGPALSPIH